VLWVLGSKWDLGFGAARGAHFSKWTNIKLNAFDLGPSSLAR